MSKKRIVICDDHEIIREAVTNRLNNIKDIEVVGEAGNGAALLSVVKELKPDLVMVDLEMPEQNGLEAIRNLHGETPGLPVIVLSAHGEPDIVELALNTGAKGFLVKSVTADEMGKAVKTVLGGKTYLGVGVEAGRGATDEMSRLAKLTPREREILGLLAKGMRARGIADELNVQPATVYTHVRNTVQKLGVDTRTQAVTLALRYSFLETDKTVS